MKKITAFWFSTVFLSKTFASEALYRVARTVLFLIIFSSFSSYAIAGTQEKQNIPEMVQSVTANDTASSCTAFEDFETGDFNSFPWESSGDADWSITSDDKYTGIYSARAGAITHNQSTSLEVTLNSISGNISFYPKVSSEPVYDVLRFYIDDVETGSWSGTQDWAQVSYPVSAGFRTFKWTYSKDGSISSESDTAWIDDIEFPVECNGPDCNTIDIGTGTTAWEYPMYTYREDSRTQVIYLASEIGWQGTLNALALNVTKVPGQTMNNWTIRMKHTAMSSYDTASLDANGWTIVYQGNEPIGSTGWRMFNFSTSFEYNGNDNLLIDFSYNNSFATQSGNCAASNPGGTRSAYAFSLDHDGDPLNWSGTSSPAVYGSSNVPNIRLMICDATLPCSVTTPTTPTGPSSSGQIGQSLCYSTGGSTCSNDHPVQYRFNWGDSNSSWDNNTVQCHSYDSAGIYIIEAQARCSISLTESNWSGGMSVTIIDPNLAPINVDLNNDGIPNFYDFSYFANYWQNASCLSPDWCQGSDFNHDGVVDVYDLQILADFWLWPVADVDMDGEVNFVDYVLFSEYWKQIACGPPRWCSGSDFDKSGAIDVLDLAVFADYWLYGIFEP